MQEPTIAAARRRLRAKLRSRRLYWSMDLGWGGFGLASLFHYKNDSPPYNKTYLVAKCNVEDEVEADKALAVERKTTGVRHDFCSTGRWSIPPLLGPPSLT